MGSAASEQQRALLRDDDLGVIAAACSSILASRTKHGPWLIAEALYELDDHRSDVIVWTIRDAWLARPNEIRRRFEDVASDGQFAAKHGALDILGWLWDPKPLPSADAKKDETRPSDFIIEQRVRNQIISYLELAASFGEQRTYQSRITYVHVPHEVINQWQDWIPDDPQSSDFDPTVYTLEEAQAVKEFHQVWEQVARTTPNPLPSIRAVQKLPEWETLRSAATDALGVFNQRGRTDEGE